VTVVPGDECNPKANSPGIPSDHIVNAERDNRKDTGMNMGRKSLPTNGAARWAELYIKWSS
jgi:hypothetical protein